MSGHWATYTCEARHLDGYRQYPLVSLGGTPSMVFDTLHTVRRPNDSRYLPNATEEQRREHLASRGWVYEVVERWGQGRFECRRGWLCPWHAQPGNRDKVAGAYVPAAAPTTS